MTTSQQRRSGRHAVPSDDHGDAPAPVVPPQREASPVIPPPARLAVCGNPSVRPPSTVGEYVDRTGTAVPEFAADVTGPEFGEWPYGRAAHLVAPAAPAPPPGNGVGRGALVFGALGLLVSLAPLFALIPSVAALPVVGQPATGLAAFPLVVVALVLGVLGTDRAAGHRGIATVGTALATAGLTLCVLWMTLMVVAVLAAPASSGDALTALTTGNGLPSN